MEGGVIGLTTAAAVLPVEEAPSLEPGSATVLSGSLEEDGALDYQGKFCNVTPKNAQVGIILAHPI